MSFTVFGLWLVVVQVRRREWSGRLQHRWGAQAVAMHFALPGVMSLLNLANPDSGVLWRTSFAALAVLGCGGVVLLDRPTAGSGALSRLVHWGGVALYGALAFVALFAETVAAGLGVLARGQQVLEELFPGLTAELEAQGVPTGDVLADTRMFLSGHRLRRATTGLRLVSASRPLLEERVRRRVRALDNVTFAPPSDVLGLVATPDRRRVTGARLLRRPTAAPKRCFTPTS